MTRIAAIVCLALLNALPARAETPIPNFWDTRERMAKPDLDNLQRLRFVTTVDFPPFNYLDASGRIAGFNVDIARAVCAELAIEDRCQIQALPWDELEPALAGGQAEAIIAGIAINAETRERLAFTRPYLQLPGRFAMTRANAVGEPMSENLEGRRVGVMDGSAHESMLRDFFPDVRVVTYSREEWMLGDLKDARTDAVFSDGMRLSFWLNGTSSGGCCRFAGGPYLAPEYFGHGMAIAVRPSDESLAAALTYALREIGARGDFAEIYLRYFPIGFY